MGLASVSSVQTRRYADIGIKPAGSLEETAGILGEALGGLVFTANSGFDEYPAFVAKHGGLQYALLGVPSLGDDIRDKPTTDFSLLVQPLEPLAGLPNEDISAKVISQIESDGRPTCWPLE